MLKEGDIFLDFFRNEWDMLFLRLDNRLGYYRKIDDPYKFITVRQELDTENNYLTDSVIGKYVVEKVYNDKQEVLELLLYIRDNMKPDNGLIFYLRHSIMDLNAMIQDLVRDISIDNVLNYV